MRQYVLTLITLLCLAAACVNFAYAGKIGGAHGGHTTKISSDSSHVSADSLLSFAESLLGTRYRPGSSSPLSGFDCSGFVSYVFKRFNFNVPRSSYEFAGVGEKIRYEDARPGDIILFTGTKTYHKHSIGHVGIVLSNIGDVFKFIHSTSGKEYRVTISAMDAIYHRRFVQIIRLLKQPAQAASSAITSVTDGLTSVR